MSVPVPMPTTAPARVLPAVLAAQLCTALADNALLIVAIALLEQRQAPGWATPALRVAFYAAYVLLAPLAGLLAERVRKGSLMGLVNLLKLVGALALLAGAHPLLVFAAVGLGASAYAPARYGILPELASGPSLLRANAAMEIVTIVAILAGTALGSVLVARPYLQASCVVLAGVYALAALCSVGSITVSARSQDLLPMGFTSAASCLLRDAQARHALMLTSLFWAAAAVLQFVLIDWARNHLGLSLAGAALLPGALAIGMVAGAVLAGSAGKAPTGSRAALLAAALGIAIVLLPFFSNVWAAAGLLAAGGVLAGALLVPMNATLQARGAALVGAGMSVAVQNCLENGLSLGFLAMYGLALWLGASAAATLFGLGGIVLLAIVGGRHARA
ncbi:MAG: lysophospholipid transporter LplT [Massilia sp.]